MRRLLLSLLGIIVSITFANADQVTEQQALQKAQKFLKGKTLSRANAKSLSRGSSNIGNTLYIFNAEDNGGFVIVSGDDRTEAILGYSDSGTMDMDRLPDNVRRWLEGYADQIRSISKGRSTARTRGTRAAFMPIEPLMKTQWSQGDPYNRMCPYDDGERCVTGCVATALAQVLYYYKWPESVGSLSGYTTYTKKFDLPELPATTFDYDKMLTTYNWDESNNDPSRDAVAKLMRYCGQSLEMDYTSFASGAAISTDVLKNYYQYSWRACYASRLDYTDDVWDQMMYEELKNARPILYDGFSEDGGHQFILDGYKDDLFHINWGWGGWCDGYFILSLANSTQPEHTATEGEYSGGQSAILEVFPGRYEKKVTVGGLQYVCDTQAMTAVVINGEYNNLTEVVIPANIQFDGKTYTVTEIANGAFSYLGNLKKVDIPSSLTKIGDFAFGNCNNLSTVICRIENPLTINENVFSSKEWVKKEGTDEWESFETFSKATLYVPEGTSSKYQEAAVWKKFPQIYEGELKETTIDGLYYSYVTGPKFAMVLAGDYQELETVSIPSSITVDGVEYKVKVIDDDAFSYCNSIKSLILSEGLEKIGKAAFCYCSGIEHLVIPEGVKTIGKNAFSGCYNVKRLDLPPSLMTIDEKAFYDMSALTAVKVAASEPLTINENVFSCKKWVKNEETGEWDSFEVFSEATLYVPEGTSSKYQEAAAWKKFPQIYEGDLKEVTVDGLNYSYVTGPKFATVLAGDYSALETVVIPSFITVGGVDYQVKVIADNAFRECRSIKSLTFSEGLEKIGNYAFYYCSGIDHLVIPEGAKTIGSYAFCGCYNVKRLELPSSLTSIDEKAFYAIRDLSVVKVAALEPVTINENVFSYSQSVKNEETDEWDWIEVFSKATLYVPEGTSSKYQEAAVWKKFPQIYEGELKETTVNGLNYSYVTGSKFATVLAGDYSGLETVVIPSTITVDGVDYQVKFISDNAFSDCSSIKSLTLSEGLEKIGNYAFYYCSGIDHLVIPEGVKTIGSYAFCGCYNVKRLELPSSLTSIDEKAFYAIRDLSVVKVGALEPFAINENVFSYTEWVKKEDSDEWDTYEVFSKATLYVPEGTSSKYQEAVAWKNFPQIYEGDLKTTTVDGLNYSYVTGSKFATVLAGDYQDLETVVIPSTITVDGVEYKVKAIDDGAFYDCGSIKSLTLSIGLEKIGNNSFSFMGIDHLVIPEGVKTIGGYALYYCYNLEQLYLPSSLTTIGEKAFNDLPNLSDVTVAALEPLAINQNVFSCDEWVKNEETGEWERNEVFSKATLYVPEGTLSKYQEADVWKEFGDIVEKVMAEGSVVPPTAITGLVYSGTAQYLINAGSSDTGIIQYSIDDTDYSTDIPLGTDAKEYAVYYKVITQEGLINVYPASLKVTIAPKTVSSPTITLSQTSYEYDGTAKEPTVTVKDGETTIPASEYTVSYKDNVEVGIATAIVTNRDGGNYTFSGSATFEITAPDIPIPDEESINISAAKQVAYYSQYDLDFTDKPELKAYVATGYDKATGTIWLTRVKQVPAKTGFLLMGEAGDYEVPVVDEATNCYYKNMFKGTISGETIYTTDGDYTNYYLSNGDYGVGFYKVGSSVALKANRAYLSIPTDIPAAGSEGDTEVIKVGSALQVPYYTSKNLDFSTMEAKGVKAYTATGYNYKTGTIWLSRVKQVPAQTGVLVMADAAGEYSVPTASVASVYANMFVGSETAQTIYGKETIDGIDYVNYYLSNGDYGVSFYKVTKEDGVALGTNRCYLPIPYRASSGARGMSTNTSSSFSKMLLLDNDDDVIAIPVYGSTDGEGDDTTNVQSSMFNVQSSDVYYNLQGQRVEKPGKGIYIRNGKKVVIK